MEAQVNPGAERLSRGDGPCFDHVAHRDNFSLLPELAQRREMSPSDVPSSDESDSNHGILRWSDVGDRRVAPGHWSTGPEADDGNAIEWVLKRGHLLAAGLRPWPDPV